MYQWFRLLLNLLKGSGISLFITIYSADNPAGISRYSAVCRNIFCHYAACANYCPAAYCHAGKNDDAAPEPAAIFDGDWESIGLTEIRPALRMPIFYYSFRKFYRMCSCVQLHI